MALPVKAGTANPAQSGPWMRAVTFGRSRGAPDMHPVGMPAADFDSVDNWRQRRLQSTARTLRAADRVDRLRGQRRHPLTRAPAKAATHMTDGSQLPCLERLPRPFRRELTPQQFVTWIQPLACQ